MAGILPNNTSISRCCSIGNRLAVTEGQIGRSPDMEVEFQAVSYVGSTFLEDALPAFPKGTAVYKIFDLHGQLIVLNRTSNMSQRMARFFGEHSERVKDLDLRQITSRIEYVRTFSPFETTFVLYLERRRYFPKTYRRMKTFRYFTLMKINQKQRFPRVYASRQIKSGVDYFGPFVTRGQFVRMKTTLVRTFKLRPCPFNIRGNDPHPDCLYFQMNTCSRPCNNDIDRSGYLSDVGAAMAFVQGHDAAIEQPWIAEMTNLAAETKFEEAEAIRKRLDRLRRARHETKDVFPAIATFNYVIALPSVTAAHLKIAIIRSGAIVAFRDFETATLRSTLAEELARCFDPKMAPSLENNSLYDEFCLVCTFMVKSLLAVPLIPYTGVEETINAIEKQRREKRKNSKTIGVVE
jgi:excinuclease UvrABC nuclease subunit